MRVGVACLAMGPFSTGDFIRRSAQAAERSGFASYWAGEHALLFGAYPESSYPYASEKFGDPPMPDPRSPLSEPLMAMPCSTASSPRRASAMSKWRRAYENSRHAEPVSA